MVFRKVRASWKNKIWIANLSSITKTKRHNHALDRHKHKTIKKHKYKNKYLVFIDVFSYMGCNLD